MATAKADGSAKARIAVLVSGGGTNLQALIDAEKSGKLKSGSSLYPLATDAAGSIIGSLASGPAAITDVDADVSREHARIYRTGQHWYIVGLNSTNGTSVISGADKVVRTVEPPRGERPRGYEPEPMEILPSDTICLGASTRFMVMPIWGD